MNDLISTKGKLDQLTALNIFRDLVTALKTLYQFNIIHRDIKPENIFLAKDRAILGDFGFCKILKEKEELVEGAFGSPMYMSPESLGNQKYGLKTDIYSLGVIFFSSIFPKKKLIFLRLFCTK